MRSSYRLLQDIKSEESPATEPALTVGSIGTVTAALIVGFTLIFHRQVNEETRNIIYGCVSIIAPLIISWLIRSKVWAPESVKAVVGQAEKEALKPDAPMPVTKLSDDFFKE
jgi:hypothetical protein